MPGEEELRRGLFFLYDGDVLEELRVQHRRTQRVLQYQKAIYPDAPYLVLEGLRYGTRYEFQTFPIVKVDLARFIEDEYKSLKQLEEIAITHFFDTLGLD